MKYATLISVTTLLALAACSTDSEPTQPDTTATTEDVIVFSCGMQETEEMPTRAATGLHDVGISSFRVWAYKNDGVSGNSYTSYQTVINGYNVWWEPTLSSTNRNNWEYVNGTTQTIKFWDSSARAYRFMAVAPYTASQGATITGDAEKSLNVTMYVDVTNEATIPYYSELWYSTGNISQFPDRQFGRPVTMQFLRPVSYVRFMFTFEHADDALSTTLSGKSFKPTDGGLIEQSGDVIISYPLTGTGTTEVIRASNVEMDGITAFTQDYYVTPDDANACKEYAVLPATNQGTYTLKVSVNGEPKSVVVPEEYMDWLPNHQYTYTFKIFVDGRVTIDSVESAFTPWVIHDGGHTIYNW